MNRLSDIYKNYKDSGVLESMIGLDSVTSSDLTHEADKVFNCIEYTTTNNQRISDIVKKILDENGDYICKINKDWWDNCVEDDVYENGQRLLYLKQGCDCIGKRAFFRCIGLESISIITSCVTSIEEGAFDGCSDLTSIYIPNSVTSIGDYAFSHCPGLTSVTIPNSVTSINSNAFSGCTGLTSVTIGNSVTSIGDYAFKGCKGLASITIPNSVTSINDAAFEECIGLKSVTIGNSVNIIGHQAFRQCPHLRYITIPNSVTSIGIRAFYQCSGLTSVTIPNSVTIIGREAFRECIGLKSVAIGNSVPSIQTGTFYECYNLKKVALSNSIVSIENLAFYECLMLSLIKIPNSVTSIGAGAFSHCECLKSVTIPNSVTSIGDFAFDHCRRLKSVTIPNSETNIEVSAFLSTCKVIRKDVNESVETGLDSVTSSELIQNAEIYDIVSLIKKLIRETPKHFGAWVIPLNNKNIFINSDWRIVNIELDGKYIFHGGDLEDTKKYIGIQYVKSDLSDIAGTSFWFSDTNKLGLPKTWDELSPHIQQQVFQDLVLQMWDEGNLQESVENGMNNANTQSLTDTADESYLDVEILNRKIIELCVKEKAFNDWVWIGRGKLGNDISDIEEYPCYYRFDALYKTKDCDFIEFRVAVGPMPEKREYYKGYEIEFRNAEDDIVRVQDVLEAKKPENDEKIKTLLFRLWKKISKDYWLISQK